MMPLMVNRMRKCRFERVILIGQGVIGRDLAKYISSIENGYQFKLKCVIHENLKENLLLKECERSGIDYICIEDKGALTDYLQGFRDEKVLVVSGFNNYLFPSNITTIDNFTIINYHNSYLPRHQGGNAITWAMFNEDEKTGATWHYVTNKTDAGDIIWQKEFEIHENAKAYEISKKSMEIAYNGFVEFFARILVKELKGKKQIYPQGKREMHLFSEIPMNGSFDLDLPVETIYRLLRSMDYGKTGGWKKPRVVLPNGEVLEVKSYRMVHREEDISLIIEKNAIYINYDDEHCLKICFARQEENEHT